MQITWGGIVASVTNTTIGNKMVNSTNKRPYIEDNVDFGVNCVIIEGIKIGSHAVVSAGAVVTKDIPPYAVVAGNPAKVLKYINHKDKSH